ncbi:ABC transporter ATP-binding protein [Lutibaculum baratangense]|uniref:Putrescine transport ATP-binding protein PotA n=1 Tax=Lutibaculum baratangense AMV1 TaxID=631454 RepID=V4RLX2_9HYPH|nr:ABC transporter ATP-binding protein [Lutibaculum baratangense]ESR27016.1 Putrescine transport ATP-binding protein PotA [Lutibaculum baratangense AMV1]
MTAVDVTAVAKSYGTTTVLSDITQTFGEGTFTSLLGPSGSGKTTLLRIVAGFVKPDAGVVRIGERDVTDVPVWSRNIGMVFQSYALFPHMSVAQNVGFGLGRRGIRGAKAKAEVERALEMVRLPGYGDRYPRQLSGGQQQRVALARAIVIRPDVLLLDEPLSALDRRLRQEMQVELLRIQRESGLTTIFVTHDQEEALTLSDSVAILDRGRIVQVGRPAEVYERPKTRFAAEFLGDANFLTGTVRGGAVEIADSMIATEGPLPVEGSQATIAVRPEKIAIDGAEAMPAAPDEPTNRLRAKVLSVIYSGTSLTYLLRSGELSLKVFAQNSLGRPLDSGTDVVLSWAPRHSVVLAD